MDYYLFFLILPPLIFSCLSITHSLFNYQIQFNIIIFMFYFPFSDFLFFLLFFAAFLPSSIDSQQNISCSPSGSWGDWANWSSCVSNLNIQRRIRPCFAQPVGCTSSQPYNCSGSYSEVRQCDSNGGWNAQMLQSLNINRQNPSGALPPGAIFSAGMVQAMNINDTYG